nr:transporter substrate-binding domain-containing protein [Bradyrhizobium sp. 139]
MKRRVLPQARRATACVSPWSKVALGASIALGVVAAAPLSAHAAAPAACAALQEKYPDWKGKTLVNAINPHTPGYETIDPKDPSKYIGFDIDLGEAIGECLGFKLTYKPVTFAALLTTLAAGRADIVISDIYAAKERAKAETDGFIFVTGQMPDTSQTPGVLPDGIVAQTRGDGKPECGSRGPRARRDDAHLSRALQGGYTAMNETYSSFFAPDRLPARTCVGVTGLAYDALIEIDLVCRRP